ncbi:MAG: LLM class flavin-dependent oxidoreductase [Rhodospirillales bacterium]
MTFRGKRLGLTMWGTEPVAAMARHAALAEQIGFDSVWTIDSQLLCRDVTVSLAAILAATTTLRAATGVTQPMTRHASVTAGMMATLAEMSDGRAIMGIGTGFSSLRTIGMKPARITEVEAFSREVRSLLRNEDGRMSWLDAPVDVPIVVAATGPRMTRAAARFGDGVILHQGLSPDLLARAFEWLGNSTAEISCWAPYSLGATPAEARDRVRSRVAGALVNVNAAWFEGAEREAVERLQAGYDVGHHASAAADHAASVPDSLVDRYALAGTAEQIRDGLARLLDQPGVDRVILNPQIVGPGAKPLDVVLRELETQVLPYL